MAMQLGVPEAEINAIAMQAQARYASPEEEQPALETIDMMAEFSDEDGDAFCAMMEEISESPEERSRRLNRERQARFQARNPKRNHHKSEKG